MRKLAPALLALAASAGFSWWAFPHLPARVPTHFDLSGQPNGWSSPLVAALFTPLLGLGLALLFSVLPNIDPKRANYALHGSTYWTIANAVLILLAAIHVVVLGKALGWPVPITQTVAVGVGGLFVLIGNLMTRIRPNWFMGIRTPWTLSSDTVWRKTHRLGGVMFVIAGCFIAVSGLIGARWFVYGMIVVTALATIVPVIYSWMLWREEQARASGPGNAA